MRKIVLVILLITAFACKEEAKKKEIKEPVKKEVVKDNIFRVFIEVKTQEDDKFQLFYIDDSPEGKFNGDKRLVQQVKGGDEVQIIQFTLPKEVLPYKFRIDLGENNYETIVVIKKVKLMYNNEVIEIDDLTLPRFFKPNVYLEKVETGYLRKTIDGRNDPFLLSTPLLIKKIELEL
jgi:hypothetical protein